MALELYQVHASRNLKLSSWNIILKIIIRRYDKSVTSVEHKILRKQAYWIINLDVLFIEDKTNNANPETCRSCRGTKKVLQRYLHLMAMWPTVMK